MIDLRLFCSADRLRPYLHKPFSYGDWSYATNGYIMVRVPRRDDVPERKEGTGAEKIFAERGEPALLPTRITLAKPKFEECEECEACDARGRVHNCPSCQCVCPACEGTGRAPVKSVVDLLGGTFDGRYVRLLAALPDLRLPTNAPAEFGPLPFGFDGGGQGVLMPMRGRADITCLVEQTAAAA